MVQPQSTAGTSADAAASRADSQGKRFPFDSVAVNTGRAALVGVISGGVAGLLAGGIGSRVAMRVVAAVGGDGIQGLETENGNIVGDITADGTMNLIIFGGALLGGIGGLIYAAARNWLPEQVWLRTALFGVFMALIAARLLLDKGNSDFLKVGHPVLSVTLFAVIPFLYGVIQVPVAGWLGRKLPPAGPSGTPAMLYSLASPIALLPMLLLFAVAEGGISALLFVVPLALVSYALIFFRANGALLGRRYAGPVPAALRFGGYAVLGVAAGLGAYVFFDSVTYHLKISF